MVTKQITCHFPYGLKENVIFILGKLSANLPDCTVEALVQPTFFTSDTEDVVFAAFPILYKSCEHQSIQSIFVDLTNLQTISRHEISVHNTNVYSPPTASQAGTGDIKMSKAWPLILMNVQPTGRPDM